MSAVALRQTRCQQLQLRAETAEQTPFAPAEEAGSARAVKVSLSPGGLAPSKPAENKNADIDERSLPDEVKQVLKMIRQLEAQLAQKRAELQALMARGNMDDEAQLVAVICDQKLTSDQSATVASVMAK